MPAKPLNPTVPSSAQLRALPLKLRELGVPANAELEKELDAFFATAPAPMEPPAALVWLDTLQALAKRSIGWLEQEVQRLTLQKTSLGDAAAIRRVQLEEPQARARGLQDSLKGRFASEAQVWRQRLDVHKAEVNREHEHAVAKLEVHTEPEDSEGKEKLVPAEKWAENYKKWRAAAFDAWVKKVGVLLADRYAALVAADLEAFRELFAVAVALPSPAVRVPVFEAQVGELPSEKMTALKWTDTLGGVVRQFPPMLIGVVATAAGGAVTFASAHAPSWARFVLVPCVALVVLALVRFLFLRKRKELVEERERRHREALQKKLHTDFKSDVDFFLGKLNRYLHEYATALQNDLGASMKARTDAELERRREGLPAQLAQLQHTLDQLSEQISQLRQFRTGLINTTLGEIDGKRREVAAAT